MDLAEEGALACRGALTAAHVRLKHALRMLLQNLDCSQEDRESKTEGVLSVQFPAAELAPRVEQTVPANERPGLGTVIECVGQQDGGEVSQQRAQCCNTTASLWLPRGADRMRKRGVSSSNPWSSKLAFIESCHRVCDNL